MDPNDTEWKLDETRTLTAMLRAAILRLDRLTRQDRGQWISRREYQKVVSQVIACLQQQCDQSERILDCIDTLASAVDKLANVVIDLQNRTDSES